MSEGLQYIDIVLKVLHNWYLKSAELAPRLVIGALVFIFFLKGSTFLSKLTVKIGNNFFPNNRKNSLASLVGVFRFLIILMGTFITLEIMGFSGFFINFIGSLGVAGVIAGVALKDLVSSIFSGMLVGIDKAFKVGDYVVIGAYSGTVIDIGFLTTKLINDEGKKVYMPNKTIFNAPFYNITASPQQKIIFDFDIPASEDVCKVQNSIREVIRNLEQSDRPDKIDVIFTSLKNGILNMQVRFWIIKGGNSTLAKSEALFKIKERLQQDGIMFTAPTSICIENRNGLHKF
ncbi:mechanosensitive ion channel [Elizabethkingia argentiflava]|uniref:Mechanosensitive ion channel n=1 Tax=Elizabethkingia argenteiflava TaxID=2681556 RepID=A0A845PPC6_9FLAO|nr:mechanosensitive ion channel domain-containing protein [Elizabethkingia argenteiflava]NAW49962.1 mechanosensitive ion channel [Elizabethkingia argenteiflava]